MTNFTRPGAISSTVWIAPASTEAWRVNGLVTAGNSVIREVADAAWPRTTNVSREIIWLSSTPAPSKPAASASWMRRISSGTGAVPGMRSDTRMGSLMRESIPAPPAVWSSSAGRDVRRAVALVDVAKRRAAGCRSGTVVTDHLQLGVVTVGGPDSPDAGLGREDVREESVRVPARDGGVARVGLALVGEIAGRRHHA